MAKNKQLVLCIDWSNIMYRSLFMSQGYGNKSTYSTDKEIESFIWKMTTDLSYILRTFKPDKSIFAIDSPHPWRKEVLPGDDGYKNNRKKKDDLNWEGIFKASEELKEIMKNHGFSFAEVVNAEGDDLMAIVKECCNNSDNPKNLIIVSADADIKQLVSFNKNNNSFCMVYNTIGVGKQGKRRLFCTQECIDYINSPVSDKNDIFFTNLDLDKKRIKDVLENNPKIQLELCNPEEVVLEKIFCGDDGDCVPSFYEWYRPSGIKDRITPAKCRKICESLGISSRIDLELQKGFLKDAIEKISKKTVNDIDVIERLERQRDLVELSSLRFPQRIQDYKTEIEYMLHEIDPDKAFDLQAKDILKDSKFDSIVKNKEAEEIEAFKDIDKYVLEKNLLKLF